MQACMSQSVQQCDHDKQTTEGTNEDTHVENAENVDEGMWYFFTPPSGATTLRMRSGDLRKKTCDCTHH